MQRLAAACLLNKKNRVFSLTHVCFLCDTLHHKRETFYLRVCSKKHTTTFFQPNSKKQVMTQIQFSLQKCDLWTMCQVVYFDQRTIFLNVSSFVFLLILFDRVSCRSHKNFVVRNVCDKGCLSVVSRQPLFRTEELLSWFKHPTNLTPYVTWYSSTSPHLLKVVHGSSP